MVEQAATHAATTLDELATAATAAVGGTRDGRQRLDVRRSLGITAFGIGAFRADKGSHVIPEHTETGFGSDGQEELYLVLEGAATFEIDGEQLEAPAGTLVFVQNPRARRAAIATTDGATVLAVGGTPGKAYDPPPPEAEEAFAAYNTGDFGRAVERQLVALEQRPDHVLLLFNAACFEARLGRTDDALAHLERAIAVDDGIKELIRSDEDLDSLRDDPRFAALAA